MSPPRTRTRPEAKWLLNELAAIKGELQDIEQQMLRLEERRARLKAVEAALCQTAVQLDVRALAAPTVRAHVRYGGRGNLRNWLRQALQAAYPKALDTGTLTDAAAAVFGLEFATSHERKRFTDNNLANALRKMLARGEVERVHDHKAVPDQPGVWRWKTPAPTLEDLRGVSGERPAEEVAQWQ